VLICKRNNLTQINQTQGKKAFRKCFEPVATGEHLKLDLDLAARNISGKEIRTNSKVPRDYEVNKLKDLRLVQSSAFAYCQSLSGEEIELLIKHQFPSQLE
jgi:hypothetical protein